MCFQQFMYNLLMDTGLINQFLPAFRKKIGRSRVSRGFNLRPIKTRREQILLVENPTALLLFLP